MLKDFDLIIANPPYGTNNNLAKKIIPVLLDHTKQATCLCPKSTYKNKDLWSKVEYIKVIDNCFDANIINLSVATLSNAANNEMSFEECGLNEKQLKLLKAMNKYNESHDHTFKFVRLAGAPIGNRLSRLVENSLTTGLCKHLEPIRNLTLDECIKLQNVFVVTNWCSCDGVHINESHDRTYNFYNKWPIDWYRYCPVNMLVFCTKQERDNFREWWYSCVEREKMRKLKSGFTNACLDLIYCIRHKGANIFESLLPHLDWTRTWTDQEVLKELGLEEDFLEV